MNKVSLGLIKRHVKKVYRGAVQYVLILLALMLDRKKCHLRDPPALAPAKVFYWLTGQERLGPVICLGPVKKSSRKGNQAP